MGNVGRAVEDAVDAVADIGADDAAPPFLGVLLNHVAELADQRARLDVLDGLLEALAGRLGDADGVGVGLGPVADVVRLVEVAVVALVVEGHVQVDNVAIQQDALVGDAVADDLVDGRADRLGEVVVVEGRGVSLGRVSQLRRSRRRG